MATKEILVPESRATCRGVIGRGWIVDSYVSTLVSYLAMRSFCTCFWQR